MAFTDLDNTAPAKIDTPLAGVIISTRAAGRGATKARYIAMSIGPLAAKGIGIHLDQQNMAVRAGSGSDHGKLAIACDAKGKFIAKKQRSSCYLLTVNASAAAGRFKTDFDRTVIEKARVVPAAGTSPPMIILSMPEGAVEPA